MAYHHPGDDETKAKADSAASTASDIENFFVNPNLTSDLNWRNW